MRQQYWQRIFHNWRSQWHNLQREIKFSPKLPINSLFVFSSTFFYISQPSQRLLAYCEEEKAGKTPEEEEVKAPPTSMIDGSIIYTGQTSWWTGKPQGFGRMTFIETGDIYEGYFYDGKFYGKGTYVAESGEKYEGDFKDGKRHGKGVLIYPNRTKYEGQFEHDRPHGKGRFTEEDGTVYDGDFKMGHRCGLGRYQSIDGSVYEGEWKHDKYHGKGKLIYSSGSIYEGGFKDGQKHGKGTLILPSGQRIDVEYQQDMRVF